MGDKKRNKKGVSKGGSTDNSFYMKKEIKGRRGKKRRKTKAKKKPYKRRKKAFV